MHSAPKSGHSPGGEHPADHGALRGDYIFCPMCGNRLGERMAAGRLRPACESCSFIHFRNPGVGAAVVVRNGGRLLLVRRGPTATQSGKWSIPAGFVDYGEDIRDGAARELLEETGLAADIGEPVWVATNFHDPAKVTVGVWFEGTVTGGTLVAGDDADDARWFDLHDLPELAFETDAAYLATLDD